MRHYDLASDSPLAPVMDLLRSVDRSGSYCTHGRLLVPMPRLVVDPAGPISFPIPKTQIRALLAQAERAPYGKGTETRVDTTVRDTWQIAADRVRLRGKGWEAAFGRILHAVTEGLGCPENGLAAELYKLLVYEPGGFFAPHRDTEKARGMVATLVIALPAAGAGGTLVVRHNGDETAIGCRRDRGQRPASRHGRLPPAVAVEAEDQASRANGDNAAVPANGGGDQTALGTSQFRRRFVQRVRARGNRGGAYQKQREKRSETPHDGGSP